MAQSLAEQTDRTGLGVVLITGSVFAMALSDALVKFVSSDVTVWQVFAIRSIVAVPGFLAIGFFLRQSITFRVSKWAVLRSVLLVLTWIAYYAALPVLSLSVAAVAVYTNPIITAVLSALILREPVRLRHWLGVFLGFAGVLIVLRPAGGDFSWYTLLPLLAALFYSLAMIITRSKCAGEAPLSLAVNMNIGFLLAGLLGTGALLLIGLPPERAGTFPFIFGGWGAIDLRILGLIALMGMLSVIYMTGVAKAYQIAAPPVIATFDYAYLISAALWSFLIFSETPDVATVLGMACIFAAGIVVARQGR